MGNSFRVILFTAGIPSHGSAGTGTRPYTRAAPVREVARGPQGAGSWER